jgi:serine/threonine protein kinase
MKQSMERWRQIESVFQEALQRDPAEREAYVREACRDDSDLRREAASLLANHNDSADSMPWAAAAAAQLIAEPASLKGGQRLGPYEILAPIGAGGMGEVYRARDTKLDRDVAIKILPPAFAADCDRMARFEREAKVLASLNHPNIAAIYGAEDRALVMELVEGPTLAERIRAGTVPLEETLTISRQITDALEAAHEKGIVHRDLKPANIKAPPDAPVKVLDFGLATAAQAAERDSADPDNSPTLTMAATEAGVIMGTAAYMSPEQAGGKRVDKRADSGRSAWCCGRC